MKKTLSFLLVVVMLFSLQGCGILGGHNRRELGTYSAYVTYDGKQYLQCNAYYLELTDDGYKLCPDDFYIESGEELPGESEIILYGGYIGNIYDPLWFWVESEEYRYLYDRMYSLIDSEYFEFILLKRGDDIYGAVNCYNRASGRSGNMLSAEDLDKSHLLSVENGELIVGDALDKVAVQAVNKTHYLSYEDKAFYSVNKETGGKKLICKDIWYDYILPYYNHARVYFVDDTFVIDATKVFGSDFKTLIVGDISGDFEVLLDNVKQ